MRIPHGRVRGRAQSKIKSNPKNYKQMRTNYLNEITRIIDEVLAIPEWEFFDRLKMNEMATFVLAVYIGNSSDDEFYYSDEENLVQYQIKQSRIRIRSRRGSGTFQYGYRVCEYVDTYKDIMRIVTGLQYAWKHIG